VAHSEAVPLKYQERTPWPTKGAILNRRRQWRKVLDLEVQRLSLLTYAQLASELRDHRVYEVELDSNTYQIELEMLEATDSYVNVMVAVDDGSLPASILPLSHSFIRHKPSSSI
jgi:hypothetical protein